MNRTMSRSPSVFKQYSQAGFSLVELMVVLFVMGLLAGVVVLSLPGDSKVLREEAERFAARTVAARDEAISGARPVAVVVGRAGYYFEQRRDGGWQPLDPGQFGLVAWKEGTAASVAGAASEAAQPGAERGIEELPDDVKFEPRVGHPLDARVGQDALRGGIGQEGVVALAMALG